jgi:phospholipase C
MADVGVGPTERPLTDLTSARPDPSLEVPVERTVFSISEGRPTRTLDGTRRWPLCDQRYRSSVRFLTIAVVVLVASLGFPGLPQSFLPAVTSGPVPTIAAAPSFPEVAGSTARGFSGSSGTSATPLAVASGDAVFVIVSSHYQRTVTALHDSSGNTYQSVGNSHSDSLTTVSAFMAADVGASSGLTVTVTLSKGAPAILTVLVVSGAASAPLDEAGPGAFAPSSSQVVANVATTSSNDLTIVAVASAGLPTISPVTSGLEVVTHATESSGSVNELGATLSLNTPNPVNQSLKATLSTAESWAALAFAVRPMATTPSACKSMTSSFLLQFCEHIQHIVFIVMENHAYDNLFGSYCLGASPYCNGTGHGLPLGTCEPELNYAGTGYPAGSCPKGSINTWRYGPQNLTTINPQHDQQSTVRAICGTTSNPSCLSGTPAMDGFWTAEQKQYTTFGQYTGSTAPIYWDIAQEYALGDSVFSSDPSYSLPNHWFIVAGQAPPKSQFYLLTTSAEHTYLNQANRTPTVQDLLNASPSTTWKYYDWSLAPYPTAISGTVNLEYGAGSAYSYWNPLAARAESYTRWYSAHFVNRTPELFDNLTQGPAAGLGLPNISWVIPDVDFSDHPPANLTAGEAFVANVLDAIEMSRYWNSTAVFLAWDDYGGFYDHVGPPKLPGLNALGLSFRVPFLVISPYTPQGRVSHQPLYFDSVLRLMEQRWGMGCVEPTVPTQDCGAPLPTSFFDFTNLTSPRAPCLFPTNASEASYPMRCLSEANVGPLDWTPWVGSDAGLDADAAD